MAKLQALLVLILAIYLASPIVFKYSTFIQRNLLFMNHVNTQFNCNLTHPEIIGIRCARTMQLQIVHEKIQLGVWHIVPGSSLTSCITTHTDNRTSIADEHAFADSRPIVLYVHGNGGTRAGDHRAQLYRRLAYEFDYHVITFDYRGYADSTYVQPTAGGLTADARFMYDWLLNQPNVNKDRVIVWGHSLGTGVAVRLVADLAEARRPSRLVLEAPFDSIANAVANHPFSTPFRFIPYFEYFFVEPIESSPELNFDSLSRICDITPTPIVILHAEDDAIIPYKLGYNLYKKALAKLGDSKVKFIKISNSHGLGHKHICNHNDTMEAVKRYIEVQ